MTRRVLIGFSGPTFYDYQHRAAKSANDMTSSPNPVLENAFGLAIFYDEIWFLCESLCPQSLRGHPSIKYLDRYLENATLVELAKRCAKHIPVTYSHDLVPAKKAATDNFSNYWQRIKQAGVFWSDRPGVALDNHTHGLCILGVEASANSNSAERLVADMRIRETLSEHIEFDLALNSFTTRLYDALYPSQFDPLTDVGAKTLCSTAVINAMVENAITVAGPAPEVFEIAADSAYSSQFRAYMESKEIGDAYECYSEISREITASIKQAVRKAADRVHPTRGVAQLAGDVALDLLPIGTALKAGALYVAQVAPRPVSAAAFMLDLQEAVAAVQPQAVI